jgi:hypothetical protein
VDSVCCKRLIGLIVEVVTVEGVEGVVLELGNVVVVEGVMVGA